MKTEVLNFINRFTNEGKSSGTIDTFTSGCCYWFSYILHNRFPDSNIMYDPVANHFVTRIGNDVYDITGVVTGKYELELWDTYDDELEKRRIIRDCVNF